MAGTKTFYQDGPGSALVDERCYPPEVETFLCEEAALLERRAATSQVLVEVGCMHGRMLDWAFARNLRYIGLDIVPKFIEQGRQSARERKIPAAACTFIEGPAERVDELIRPRDLDTPATRVLMFFPFNSIGNMAGVDSVVEAVARSGLPFVISSYETTEVAAGIRRRYYEQCGYQEVKEHRTSQGCRFTSADGLDTIAYHPATMRGCFERHGLVAKEIPFAGFGMAYVSP